MIDPRTLNPLDKKTILASVKKTGRLLVVHQACKTSGFGAEIAAMVAEEGFEYLVSPIRRLGSYDVPVPVQSEARGFRGAQRAEDCSRDYKFSPGMRVEGIFEGDEMAAEVAITKIVNKRD